MKKVLFSLAALCAFGIASAQESNGGEGFKSGDVFASGTVSYDAQKTGDVKTNAFTFTPSVGYFFTDKIAAGVNLGFSSAKNYDGGTEVKTTGFSAGVFGRYYFTTGTKFNVFGQLNVAYATSKDKYEGGGNYKVNGFGAGVAPGFNYWLSDHFALESTVGILSYGTQKPDGSGAEKTNTFNVGLNFTNVNFGLVYKF